MITLFQFQSVWGLPNASPFCMKIETYLRMVQLPYEIKVVHNPQQAPYGKLPFILLEGVKYPDSELIIDALKKRFGDELDKHLTDEQKALGVLIDNVFCEHLYWMMVFMRWQDDAGWNEVNKGYFSHLPPVVKWIVPMILRKKMIKALYTQGMGRHNKTDILAMGRKTIDALAVMLGSQPYFLGDTPSSVDATAFGFLANILFTPLNDPLKQHALSLDNLKAYCDRMWGDYYPDFKILP